MVSVEICAPFGRCDSALSPGPEQVLRATRARSQMKMLFFVQNEMFTFEIDSEHALVGSTLERLEVGVFSVPISEDLKSIKHLES